MFLPCELNEPDGKKVSVKPDRKSQLSLMTVVKASGSLSSIREMLPFMNSSMDILDPCTFPFVLYNIAMADNPHAHFPYEPCCYRSFYRVYVF